MSDTDLWYGTDGPRNAQIAIVGESYGVEERDAQKPFVGAAGQLLTQMLTDAGIVRDQCFITNVLSERPPQNDMQQMFEYGAATLGGLRPGPAVQRGVAVLRAQLAAVKPKIVLAFGNYALWALTRHAASVADGPRPRTPSGVLEWRGSQVYMCDGVTEDEGSGVDTDVPVLPLVHPAAILRDWAMRWPTVHDLRQRVPLALRGQWSRALRNPPYDLRCGVNFPEVFLALDKWIKAADASHVTPLELSGDIETWRSALITCIGIADSAHSALSIPFVRLVSDRELSSFWSAPEEAEITRMLAKLLNHPRVSWIGQNFLYDRAFLWEWWRVEPRLGWDTLVAQNLLLPGTQKDLGYLSSIYCRHHRFWKRDARGWEDAPETGLEQLLLYNAEDAARTFEIAATQQRAMTQSGSWDRWQHELSKIALAWEMQRRGMCVDAQRRGVLALELIDARSQLAEWLEAILPQTFSELTPKSGTRWYDSPRQTAHVLYELLQLRTQYNRRSGSVSADDEALESLKTLYPKLADLFEVLAEYRSLGVLYATFVESKLEPDGKFRTSFNPAGTVTFRFSSSLNPFRRGGNAQNIPVGDEE